MTVSGIKKFIDNSLDEVINTKRVRQKNKILISILKKVVFMLDELEDIDKI